jgi:hypothetical protein
VYREVIAERARTGGQTAVRAVPQPRVRVEHAGVAAVASASATQRGLQPC